MEGARTTQSIQSDGSTLSTPSVDEEGIMQQVLGKQKGHMTRVGPTLPRRTHSGASSSSRTGDDDGCHASDQSQPHLLAHHSS
ncbi:hypothetical protein TIFTF001_043142 [Ficus carica]|uniref:Uncharacterized protein n=1 Tax=Ficus carica TaxID=3494 RepID=A0AA87YWM2_FICCA|nr:hypothetical protein TIFTF001_043142 [Ficus carica]